jgi:hypothetical protein
MRAPQIATLKNVTVLLRGRPKPTFIAWRAKQISLCVKFVFADDHAFPGGAHLVNALDPNRTIPVIERNFLALLKFHHATLAIPCTVSRHAGTFARRHRGRLAVHAKPHFKAASG